MDNDNSLSKKEFGDYQTPLELSDKIYKLLLRTGIDPDVVIEPTCGKGSFLISALNNLSNLSNLIGIEINQTYYLKTLEDVLKYYISNPVEDKTISIEIINKDIFYYDLGRIIRSIQYKSDVCIIGNPPWVTNSYLSLIQSDNLPAKYNFKNHSGLDALTGKSNFDISETVALLCLDVLHSLRRMNAGRLFLAFLLKDTVVKNIVYDLSNGHYHLKWMKAYSIDAKAQFNANAQASLFLCEVGNIDERSYTCEVYRSIEESKNPVKTFGWDDERFVSDVNTYQKVKQYDGLCPFQWRQGIKHDCAKVMVLKPEGEGYTNGLGENVHIEETHCYPLVKGSELKQSIIDKVNKYLIVTQERIGQDTSHIKHSSPRLYHYLEFHRYAFDRRRSRIYNDKPAYSIFGVGDYTFKRYKVGISGFGKEPRFSLILPCGGKPVVLDDTSYFLGFDELHEAVYAWFLLNSDEVRDLLSSIVFVNGKRPFTKSILMRIDLPAIGNNHIFPRVKDRLAGLYPISTNNLNEEQWESFIKKIND